MKLYPKDCMTSLDTIIESNASNENINDFYRNIMANMISERFKI